MELLKRGVSRLNGLQIKFGFERKQEKGTLTFWTVPGIFLQSGELFGMAGHSLLTIAQHFHLLF
jgi:hypothetical protein